MIQLTLAVVAASGAALALACAIVVRSVRARTDRRIAALVQTVAEHLDSTSQALREAVERSTGAGTHDVGARQVTLDLEELLAETVAEAAARTGAEAVAMRVEGPGGGPMTALLGEDRIDWSNDDAFAPEPDESETRLVVPLVEGGVERGVIVAHARPGRRFLAGHRRALLALAEESSVAVASARRFTRAARRAELDDVTGLPNRHGFEAVLEREVERASRTRRPLSLVVLALYDVPDAADVDGTAEELAALLGRASRTRDMVFRHARGEFGVLLPETSSEGAQFFHRRLRAELEGSTFSEGDELTFSTGISEWRRDESWNTFAARARATVGDDRVRFLGARRDDAPAADADVLDAPGTG